MLLYNMNIDIFDKATELSVIQSQTKDFFFLSEKPLFCY